MTRPVLDPMPGRSLDAPLRGELAQLVDGTVADRVGRVAERLFLVAAGAPALEQRRDAVERLDRIHRPEGTSLPLAYDFALAYSPEG